MPLFRKLATLATAAEAARRYAKKNPDKASKYLDQAAQFLDKQTKGKYSGQINGVASKAKNVAGIKPTPANGATGNGYTPGATDLGSAPDYGQPKPSPGPVQH
jgi:alkylation response protein AidB-like acyl-CoA dehydrogenase